MTDFANDIPLLNLLIAIPVVGAGLIAVLPRSNARVIRAVAILSTVLSVLLALVLLLGFEKNNSDFQFVSDHQWLPAFGVSWKLGIDGISLFLVALSTLIFLLAVLWPHREASGESGNENIKSYMTWVLLLQAGCVGSFLALDLFLFFVFFEVVLVPMYFLIVGWGFADKSRAALKFFLFTLAGSAFLFIAMLALVWIVAESNNTSISFDLLDLSNPDSVTATQARWLFVGFAIAFAVKIPIFPLHTWLPITYAQSPVAGVVISSAVMVKLGTYGLVRYGVYLFPDAARDLGPWLLTLAVIGMVYGAAVAAVQRDLRRLLAYSSLSHVGFIVLGTFAFSQQGLTGAVVQMVNHGIIASALFLLLGMIYIRFGSMEIEHLRGIQKRTPVLAALFTIAVMASIGVPGLNGFVGEFLVLIGTFVTYRWWAVVGTLAVIIAAVYLLWAYQRAFHGEPDESSADVKDLSWGERAIVAPLIVLIVVLGVFPQPVIDRIEPSVDRILERNSQYVSDSAQPGSMSSMYSAEVPLTENSLVEERQQ